MHFLKMKQGRETKILLGGGFVRILHTKQKFCGPEDKAPTCWAIFVIFQKKKYHYWVTFHIFVNASEI